MHRLRTSLARFSQWRAGVPRHLPPDGRHLWRLHPVERARHCFFPEV